MAYRIEYIAVFNRVFALISGVILLLLNLYFIDTEGQGSVALVNLGILIHVSIAQFLTGGALIYLIPRNGFQRYIAPSTLWIVFSSVVACVLFYILNFDTPLLIVAAGCLQSFFMFCQVLLLSQNNQPKYQFLLFIQAATTPLGVFSFYFQAETPSFHHFIYGILVAFAVTSVSGWWMTRIVWKEWKKNKALTFPVEAWKLGSFAQSGNIFHLLNQRSYLFFLEKISLHSAGVFSILLYIMEALLSVSKSLSAVQNATIAQSDQHKEHFRITGKYMIWGLTAAILGYGIFVILPEKILHPVFRNATSEVQQYFPYMILALVLSAFNTSVAHLFSGKGKHFYNAIAAAAGFIAAILSSMLFITSEGIPGAIKAISIAFLVNALVQTFFFFRLKEEINAGEGGQKPRVRDQQ